MNDMTAKFTRLDEDTVDPLDLLLVIAREKRSILRATAAAAILSAAIAMLLPAVYSAKAVILPPQEDHSGLSSMTIGALAELSSVGGGSGGLGGALGLKNPSDIYIGMLKSRSVADALIQHFQLQALYGTDNMAETREALDKQVSISNGADGLISVTVEDEDAQRAASIANAYVDQLEKLTRRIAITEAAQRRLFIEQQIKVTQEKLAQAENALKHTQERTGVIDLDNQGKAIIDAMATLRGQAAAKEVQIATMRSYAAAGNPDLIHAQHELAGLRTQIGKLEHDSTSGNGDIMVATGRMPEAGLEYLRKLRDMKYQQAVFEMLAKQYESARVDEARNSVVIQVVDPALPPDEESGPRRGLIVLLATVFTLLLAIMWTFARAGLQRTQLDAERHARWSELREHLAWRR